MAAKEAWDLVLCPGKGMILSICAAGLLAVAGGAFAAEVADLDELDGLLQGMGLEVLEPKEPLPLPEGPLPPPPPVDFSLKDPVPPPEPPTLQSLTREVEALRLELERMQATLDLVVESLMMDMSDQNRRLREENAQLRRDPSWEDSGMSAPVRGFVPPPPTAIPFPDEPIDPSDLRYAVIKEWGRSAKDAARLGEGVSSLKGMICAVPPGSTGRELLALGRWLRTEHGAYDNINIDVFDSADSARVFAERNEVQGDHRVLTVTKFGETERDVITLVRDGKPTEYPYTP
jgi:hypothetical protein